MQNAEFLAEVFYFQRCEYVIQLLFMVSMVFYESSAINPIDDLLHMIRCIRLLISRLSICVDFDR